MEFHSKDKRFGLRIPEKELNQMLRLCEKARQCETGGILVGQYTEDLSWALVRSVSRAPADSDVGRWWFSRGVRGLQRWLNRLWKLRYYYLGEWHYHPTGPPAPSQSDRSQMEGIAASRSYQCPEPVLMLIGGDPPSWWRARAFVYQEGQSCVEMIERRTPPAMEQAR